MPKKKNKAAQELGRQGGLARARKRTKEELSAIGKAAITARWETWRKERGEGNPPAPSGTS